MFFLPAAFDRACPEGIDVYFDNTGGEIFDAVMTRIRRKVQCFEGR
jgi:NADPH-dependent curcumin reductase CurA